MMNIISKTYRMLPYFLPKSFDILTKHQVKEMIKNKSWKTEDGVNFTTPYQNYHYCFKLTPKGKGDYYLEVQDAYLI